MEFKDNSRKILDDIEWRTKKALTENALILERDIVLLTPVDTGRLRASISHIAPLSRSPETQSMHMIEGPNADDVAYVGTNVSYAPHVEYGTKYQRPQSYMRAGFEKARPKMERNMRRNLEK